MIIIASPTGAVDEVQRAGEAGFGLERGDHLVGDDAVHGGAAGGGRPAFDELCVHEAGLCRP
jgi:hypothetical protein